MLIAVLLAALVISLLIGISIGTVTVPIGRVWRIIGQHLHVRHGQSDPLEEQIIWEFRTPRVLLAAVVGAALSVAGVALQVLARNGLADPYILGVSSGASLGAVIVIAYGSGAVGGIGVSGAAFLASVITLFVVFGLAQRSGRVGPTRLVLSGIAVSYLVMAATNYIQIHSNPLELRGILFWMLGSLAAAKWSDLGIPTVAIFVSLGWLLVRARAMNVLTAGDDVGSSLGIEVNRLRIELLVVSSLLTAAAVSVAGGIGFVGLMVPHAARLVVGPDHRRVLPIALLVGAVFMVLVDLLSRVVDRPNELPVGVFTAAIGAPFFILLLRRGSRGEQ